MKLDGAIALITGGGHGIGRSIAHELSERGAAATVIVDLDGDAAAAVADEVAGIGFRADASDPDEIEAVVRKTEEQLGPIDVLFSNVGMWVEGDVTVDLSTWNRVWQVNVVAHVVAVRAVLPAMLERNEGHIAITASAAGILSSIGSATYAVTKAGAVALAEWMMIEYGATGVEVSCLCPLAVDTSMLRDSFSDPSRKAATAGSDVLPPDQVAATFLDGVEENRFLILTHEKAQTFWEHKVLDHDRWLRGMQKLRHQSLGNIGNGDQ